MSRRLLLELVADPEQMLRSLKRSSEATDRYSADLKQLGLTAEQSARKQVEAATRRDARLRAEVTAYKQLASAASRGSREQVIAANKAAEAERVLARSLGTTSAEARAHARSVASSERELGRFSRGALAGSGVARSMGRSLAFASGGFLAFASASEFLRKSIEAATEAAATERQLGAQFRAVGQDAGQYRQRIDEAALATSRLSGFTRDDLVRSFTTAFRATGDVDKALTIMRASADAARGSHKDLAAITLALTRAWGGAATSLRRLGILIPATAKGMDAIAFVQKRFAGQAQAGTTAQERFGAALHNTQETVGMALLPTLERYLNRGSAWLGQAKNQERVQRDVTDAVKVGSQVVHGLGDALKAAAAIVRPVNKLLGGTQHTVTLLAVAFGVAKVRAGLAALGFQAAGDSAAVASGKVGLLSTRLGRLPTKIGISIVIAAELYGPTKRLFDQVFGPTDTQTGSEAVADRNAGLIQALGLRRGDYRFGRGGKLIVTPQGRQHLHRFDQIEQVRGIANADAGRTAPRGPLAFSARFAQTEMRLAEAQLTAGQGDDRRILQVQAALIRRQIALLHSRRHTFQKRLQLTQQLVGVEGQIGAIDQAAENKRDEARKARVDAAKKAAAKAKAHADAEKRAAEKEQAALKRRLEQARQALAAAVDAARGEIGALFQGPVLAPTDAATKAALGVPGPDPGKILADVRAQNAQALRFERDLRKLRALGVSKATLTELRGEGTGVTASIEAILAAPRGKRAAIIRALVAREGVAHRIGQMVVHSPKVTVHANHVVVSGGGARTLQNSRSGRYAGN